VKRMGRIEDGSLNRERCVDLLADLISIDSVNPSLSPGHRGEGELADYLLRLLKSMGLEVEEQEVQGERRNILGTLTARLEGPRLLLVSHMDTVGVESMTIPPFRPRLEGDRMFGRGSSDNKGGMTALLMALEEIVDHPPERGEVVFAATVDEEYQALGVEKLIHEVKADGALVMEPVDMRIVIAHKGFVWQEFEVVGRAAHGSDHAYGIDSIMGMGSLLLELARMNEQLMRVTHPLLGPPSLHASQIWGGEGWSTYPAICRLRVERRTVPGETEEAIAEEFKRLAASLRGEGIDISTETVFSREATETEEGERVVRCLRDSARSTGFDCPIAGMSAWPEAGALNQAGIPSVVFGPGGCMGHEANEFVRVGSVLDCATVVRETIMNFLDGDRERPSEKD
jgi:acetylornithine deacetylase